MATMSKFNRRNFLKGSASLGLALNYSSSALAVDSQGQYRSWEDVARKKWTWDKVSRSTHGTNCTGQCAFNVYVKNGVVWREEQQGEYGSSGDAPDYGPRGCQKGLSHSRYMYGKQRILYPLKRVGERGEGKWERITWEQAMTEIADKFIDHSVEYGPEAITCGLGTQMVMKRASYASIMRFANITGVQMPEAFAGVGDLFSGAQITLGHVTLGNTMAEIYKSKCCLIWFCNPAVTRIPDAHFFWEAKYNGTEVISISPDFNATAMHASKWLNPKPGTDIALAMAMIETIISDKSYDEDYMREQSDLPFLVRKDNLKYLRETDLPKASADAKDNRFYFWDEKNDQLTEAPGTGTPPAPPPGTPEHLIPPMPSIDLQGLRPAIEGEWTIETKDGPVVVTTVFELVKQRASEHTPEYAEEITGISAKIIRNVARKFSSSKPGMIYAGYRASKYLHGDLLQRALFLLLCITGNTGKEGGGLTITNLAKDESALFPFALKNPIAAFRVSTLSRWDYVHANMKEFNEDIYGKELAEEYDHHFQESVKNGWFPDYSKKPWKMGLFSGTNAASWRSSGKRWRENAFSKLDTIATFATDMGATAMYSDYVLPISHHYERHDFHLEPRTPYMQVIDKAVEPLGESVDDWTAYKRLAEAISIRAKERNVSPIPDNVVGVPFARDMTKYHDEFTDEGKIKSVKDVIQFLLDNTTGIQNVKYEELAAKGFLRNKGSETTLHSKESPFFSEIYDNVREKTGYKTLTHRQQFYIDHDWFMKFDEALPGHKDAIINEGYPMKMLMGHARHGIHSMWRDDSFLLSLQRGEPDVYVNPEDAKTKDVEDGELIRVFSKSGSFIAQAHVTSAMGPNMLYMYHGWDPMMFRGRENFGAVVQTGGLIKPTSLVGDYEQLGWKPFAYEPNHTFHDFTCDFEKYSEA